MGEQMSRYERFMPGKSVLFENKNFFANYFCWQD